MQSASADPLFSLQGGNGPMGRVGQQSLCSADGATETGLATYRGNGQRFLDLQASGQAVDLQPFDVVANHYQGGTTFTYTPMGEVGAQDVVGGFKLGGGDHDTLALPSSDFRDFADLLRHTTDSGDGATIADPNNGDSIRLRGVTEAALKAHPKDFTFG